MQGNNQGGGLGGMPTFDQKVKNKAQAQSDFQLQQAIMNAPQEADPNQVVNQVGAQSATQNAGQAAQQQQTSLGSQLQDTQNQLQQQNFSNQMSLKKGQQQLSKEKAELNNRVQEMDGEFRQRYVDNQINFRKVKNEAVIDSEQQMMDYMISKQADDREWQKYARAVKQGHQERQTALNYSYQVLSQTLDQDNQMLVQKYGQASVTRMRAAKEAARKKMEEEANKGSMMGMAIGGAMTVAGGILCAIPGGAVAGAPMMASGVGMVASSYSDTGEYK